MIQGERRNVVHIESCLVEAASRDQAHRRARVLGSQGEHRHLNTDSLVMRQKFGGLRDRSLLLDRLEHGAELSCVERIDLPGRSSGACSLRNAS